MHAPSLLTQRKHLVTQCIELPAQLCVPKLVSRASRITLHASRPEAYLDAALIGHSFDQRRRTVHDACITRHVSGRQLADA
jgi:hypothetical protein